MISFIVQFASGKAVPVSLPETAVVADVKAKLFADAEEKVEGNLLLAGKPLREDVTLAAAGVREEDILVWKSDNENIRLSATCEVNAVVCTEARKSFTTMVSLKAPTIQDVQRVPIDLCIVVDRSGSMASLMSLVIETLEFVVKQLQPTDRLSIVEYDNRITTLLGLTCMTSSGKDRAIAAANTLTPRGGTDLAGGLFHGMQVIQNRGQPANEVASVLLFTDGQANNGIRDQATIIKLMKDKQFINDFSPRSPSRRAPDMNRNMQNSSMRSSRNVQQQQQQLQVQMSQPMQQQNVMMQQQQAVAPPVQQSSRRSSLSRMVSMFSRRAVPSASSSEQAAPSPLSPEQTLSTATEATTVAVDTSYTVNTFGFGANHNEDLLKAIAETGKGQYFFIENRDVIGDCFVDCVGGLLSVVGQNLVLTLETANGVELTDAFTSFPKTRLSKSSMAISIKDLQSEESRDFLCQVALPALSQAVAAQPVLSASLSYDNLVSNRADTQQLRLTLGRPAKGSEELKRVVVNTEVTEQKNRVDAAACLEKASKLGDASKLKEARAEVQRGIAELNATSTRDSAQTKELLRGLNVGLSGLKEQRTWRDHGSKMSKGWAQCQQQQRGEYGAFTNAKKSRMKSAYHAKR